MFNADFEGLDTQGVSNVFKSGVYHEDRDARMSHDVVLPFSAAIADSTFKGSMFSMERIVLDGTSLEGQDWSLMDEFFYSGPEKVWPLQMRLLLNGYVFEFLVQVRLDSDPSSGELVFQIVDMNPTARKSLRRVVRSFFNGRVPDADDLMNSQNDETPIAKKGAAKSKGKRLSQLLTIAASTFALLVLSVVSLVSIYNSYGVVQSEFATVTTPQTTIRSGEQGQIVAYNLDLNEVVNRDTILFETVSSDLESKLALAETQLDYVRNIKSTGSSVLSQKIAAAKSSAGDFVISLDPASLSDDGADQEINLEAGRLKALQLRKAGLSAYSPCNCVVAWAETNGSWVQAGDPVAILADANRSAMRIEALVHLDDVDRLTVGQHAYVEVPQTGDLVVATVESIHVGAVRQTRFGFPDWLKKQPTLASVTLQHEQALPFDWISQPLKVQFAKPISGGLVESFRTLTALIF